MKAGTKHDRNRRLVRRRAFMAGSAPGDSTQPRINFRSTTEDKNPLTFELGEAQ